MLNKFKDLNNKILLYRLSAVSVGTGISAGIGVSTGLAISGLPGILIAVTMYTFASNITLIQKRDFADVLNNIKQLPHAEIWKDELSNLYMDNKLHSTSRISYFIANPGKMYMDLFDSDTNNDILIRSRIKATIGVLYNKLCDNPLTSNVNNLLECLIFLDKSKLGFIELKNKLDLTDVDESVLDILKKENAYDVWFDYLHHTKKLGFKLNATQERLMSSIELTAADIKCFLNIPSDIKEITLDSFTF